MAISLKEQLRIIQEGVHYHAPFINVTKSGAQDSSTRANATKLFYDFYAMELMHRQLGSPRPDPSIAPGHQSDPTKARVLTPSQAKQYRAAIERGVDPLAAGVAGWEDVEFPPMGGTIVPAQLRKVIDQVFDEVTIQLSRKISAHLRLSIMQEFRYILNYSPDWITFRHRLVGLHNQQGKVSKEEFNANINMYIPKMVGHEDAVLRLLKFCKYYAGMNPDPFDFVSKDQENPKVGNSELEPEPTQSEPEPEPKASAPEEPDDTDYNMPTVEVPPGADWGDDDLKHASTDVETDKIQKWLKTHKNISESITHRKILLREMSPNIIIGINQAILKSGVTWDDISLAYNKIGWGGSAFGGPKWGEGTDSLIKLAAQTNEGNIEDMASVIDHIYDLEHNGGALLNKGGMYVSPSDLDRRAKTTHIARYLPFVSPLIKRLIVRVLGYLSDNPDIEQDINKVTQSPDKPFPPEVEAVLTANKFVKSSVGNEWQTQAPYENKKGITIQNQYTAKFHTNGMYSVQDSMNADIQVFETPEKLEKWLTQNVFNFIKPIPGVSTFSKPKVKSKKDEILESHTKIKLDAAKETQLLEQCKMGWRPSTQYYKAYLPGDDRVQLFAFSNGTYMVCKKSNPNEVYHKSFWDSIFLLCKTFTENALPNEDYDASKAWIGKSMGGVSSVPFKEPLMAPSVGTKPSTEYSLNNVEVNTFQILANQTGGTVTVEPNTAGSGMTLFLVNGSTALAVGKKSTTPTGQTYVVKHGVVGSPTEQWSFSNWNKTYSFVANNFAALTQIKNPVQSTVSTLVTPQIFSQSSDAPLPPPSPSKASYKAHVGITKPPTHTIRLTQEDENALKSVGFEPKMQGSDVWYMHKKIGDVAKFYPNDVAKILIIMGNTHSAVTKKIADAISWLVTKYQGASVSPLVAPSTPVKDGMKAGAMFEKTLNDAGFVWDHMGFDYVNVKTNDTIKISPYPKSTYTNGQTGEVQHFNSLPEMAMFVKKKVVSPKPPAIVSASTESPEPPVSAVPPLTKVATPDEQKFQVIHDNLVKELKPFRDEKGNIPSQKTPPGSPQYHNNKVGAVVYLRHVMLKQYGLKLSLGEGKWIVENVKIFLNYVKNYGLPDSLIDIDKVVGKWAMADENPTVSEDDYNTMHGVLKQFMNLDGDIPMSTPINSSNKIAAIKTLKNYIYSTYNINLSLGNAKRIIEHVDDFLEYVRMNGIAYFLKNIEDVVNKWSYKDSKPKEEPSSINQPTPEVKEVPEAKLPELIEKHGFKFETTINITTMGGVKEATMYRNSNGDTLYLFHDGTSNLYLAPDNNPVHKFNNVSDLVNYLETTEASPKLTHSTGDVELDEEIDIKGFKLMMVKGNLLQFLNKSGTVLYYDVADHSSSVKMKGSKNSFSFTDNESLMDHLQNSSPEISEPETPLQSFAPEDSVELSADNENKLGFQKVQPPDGSVFYTNKDFDVVFLKDGTASVISTSTAEVQKFNTYSSAIQYLVSKKSESNKNKTVLAGTENMPFSGMNYKIMWNTQPPKVPLSLTPFDETTMKSMGWNPVKWGGGLVYQNYNRRIAFYNHGGSNYWSNFNTGGVTQIFPSVEDTLRWLWKNKVNPTPKENPLGESYYPKELVVKLLTTSGFTSETMPNGVIRWVHPSQFNFELHTKGIRWYSINGVTELEIPLSHQGHFLTMALTDVDKSSSNNDVFDLFNGESHQYLETHSNKLDSDKTSGGMYYPDIEVVNNLKSVGFHPEMLVYGTKWVHPSKFTLKLFTDGIMWTIGLNEQFVKIPQDKQAYYLKKTLASADKNTNSPQMEWYFNYSAKHANENPKAENLSKVPYSGVDYRDYFNKEYPNTPNNEAISLVSKDEETLASMGFEKETDSNAGIAFRVLYYRKKSDDNVYFFAGGQASYWATKTDGPHYFNTAMELMQFLWDKYSPNIQEGSLRDYLRKWLI